MVAIRASLGELLHGELLRMGTSQGYMDFTLNHKNQAIDFVSFVVNNLIIWIVVLSHKISYISDYLFIDF